MQSPAAVFSSSLWQQARAARGPVAGSKRLQQQPPLPGHPLQPGHAPADQDSRFLWCQTAAASRRQFALPSGSHNAAAFPGSRMRDGARSAAMAATRWWHPVRSRCTQSRALTGHGRSTAVSDAPGSTASGRTSARAGTALGPAAAPTMKGICGISDQGSPGGPRMLRCSASGSAFPGNTPTSMYKS
jgi:hypothetical protein